MKYLAFNSRRSLAVILGCFLVFASVFPLPSDAQTPCGSGTLATNGPLTAWPQNALVSVNINAGTNQFTQAEFDNCIKPVFDAYNAQNGATQGNYSGVRFSVSFSENAVAVVNNNQADNVGGVSRGFQINRSSTLGSTVVGQTYRSDDGTNRDSAVTEVNTAVTDCTALAMNIAHEIGHTLGLGECTSCAAHASVMNRRTSMNDTSQGATAPTDCDQTGIRASGGYSQGSINQPPDYQPPPCPGVECNEGSGIQIDTCTYGAAGCPYGWVNTGQCCQPWHVDPIVIDVDGSGFYLTDAQHGVSFDFFGVKKSLQLPWIAQHSTNAFLVLDIDGNGTIDSGRELFGNMTPQPKSSDANGFLALAEYDKQANGGNGDGVIDYRDAVYSSLRLWRDSNHNGVSETTELHSLAELGVATIELDYKLSKKTDEYGNQFRYRGKVRGMDGAQLGRWAWDVILKVPGPNQ